MRKLNILFTTEDEIFFVNEAKELEFYRDNGDGKSFFGEMFGYSEELENWTSDQLSEMVSNGLYVDSVDLFILYEDQSNLFDEHPELYEFVEIDKCFGDLESDGNALSVMALISVLETIPCKHFTDNGDYILQCHALARKLEKKEAIEKKAIHATWRAEYEERLLKQARQLERVVRYKVI